jgi:hypothetical protein
MYFASCGFELCLNLERRLSLNSLSVVYGIDTCQWRLWLDCRLS